MTTELDTMDKPEALLTVGIEGSFGVLHYAVLALTAGHHQTGELRNGSEVIGWRRICWDEVLGECATLMLRTLFSKPNKLMAAYDAWFLSMGLFPCWWITTWCGPGTSTRRTRKQPSGLKLPAPGK